MKKLFLSKQRLSLDPKFGRLILTTALFCASTSLPALGQNLTQRPGRPVINVPELNEILKARQKVEPWGCEGLFCTCDDNANSPSCKIVAPYCADDIICIGKSCSCVWGGGP